MSLHDRIESLARDLAKREARYGDDLERARDKAAALHRDVSTAIDRFNEILGAVVPDFDVVVSAPRIDDKHLHAVEFDLERGRHRAVVTVKSKGEVTLVGPFRTGKKEGPCRSFPVEAQAEIDDAIGDFLEQFLREAVSP